MLTALLRVLAFILLAITVVTLPFSLLLRDVGALAFEPETTKALVRDYLLNSDLIASLARRATEQMLSAQVMEGEQNMEAQLVGNALSGLSEEDWRKITEFAAPEELIEQTVDEVVDGYADWLNSDAGFPPLQVDLAPWKQNTREHAAEVMTVVLNSLPECTVEEAATIALEGITNGENIAGIIPFCRPPEPVYTVLLSNADFILASTLEHAPDTIDLSHMTQGQEAPEELVRLKAGITRVRSVSNWTWAAVVGVGVLAVAMAARTLKQALRWSGWPLLLAGGITLFLGLGLQFFSLRFLDTLLLNAFSGDGGTETVLAGAVAAGALDLVSKPLLLQGALLTAAGLAALIYARILQVREVSPGVPINKKRINL